MASALSDCHGASASPCTRRLKVAKAWLKANAAPATAFPGLDLFTNPAWNILLDLYVASRSAKPVSVGSACIAAGVPSSTAARYIVGLIDAGLIQRIRDPDDRRKHYVGLTPAGFAGVERAIDWACESDRKLGLGRLELVY